VKLLRVHVCPVWQEQDGSRRPGIDPDPDHPPVVGWCNVLVIRLGADVRRLLAVHYRSDAATP
jgi:hypothetical protein